MQSVRFRAIAWIIFIIVNCKLQNSVADDDDHMINNSSTEASAKRSTEEICNDSIETIKTSLNDTKALADYLFKTIYEDRIDLRRICHKYDNDKLLSKNYDTNPTNRVLKYLLLNKTEIAVHAIHESMVKNNLLTAARDIIFYLTILPKELMTDLRKVYQATFNEDLESAFQKKFDFKFIAKVISGSSVPYKVLLSLLDGDRNDEFSISMNDNEIATIAEKLYNHGGSRFTITDEDLFIQVLTKRSFKEIRFISYKLSDKYKVDLLKAIGMAFINPFLEPSDLSFNVVATLENIAFELVGELNTFLRTAIQDGNFDKSASLIRTMQDNYLGMIKTRYSNIKKNLENKFGDASYFLLKF